MLNLLKVLFIMIVLIGCAGRKETSNFNDMIRRTMYIDGHRNSNSNILTAIEHGMVIPGMNPFQVQASIGSPADIKTEGKKNYQVWIYKEANYKKIVFENNIVIKAR